MPIEGKLRGRSSPPAADHAEPAAGRALVQVVGAIVTLSLAVYAWGRLDGPDDVLGAPTPSNEGRPLTVAPLLEASAEARRILDADRMREAADRLLDVERKVVPGEAQAVAVELVRLQAARALELAMRASLDLDQREPLLRQRDGLAHDAERRFRQIATDELDRSVTRILKIEVELAIGGEVADRLPTAVLPTPGAPELRVLVLAAPVWESSDAVLEPAVLDEIRNGATDDGRVAATWALSQRRSGDVEGLAQMDRTMAATPLMIAVRRPLPSPPLPQATIEKELGTPVSLAHSPRTTNRAFGPDHRPRAEPSRSRGGPPVRPAEPSESALGSVLDRGCDLAERGQGDQAIPLLQQAFDNDPGGVRVTLCMAEAHLARRRHDSAHALVRRVLQKVPTNSRALALAARVEEARGNTSTAADLYRKLLETDPRHKAALDWLARHGS